MSDSDAEPTAPTTRKRSRGRRGIRLAIVLLFATIAYWVASYAARPLAESWLTRTLGAPVEIRRVGFDPIDAVVTLEGLVAHLPEGNEWSDGPIVADRARIDLQWFPLIHRRLQVRELALESAVVQLAHLPDSIPGLEAIQAASAPETLPQGWTLQIDRLALRDSLVRLASDGDGVPLVVSLQEAEVLATRRRTSVLGATTNLRLEARLEGGRFVAEGHYAFRPEGLSVSADVRASDLPTARLLEYLPVLGVRNLSGRLEAEMRYVFDPRRNAFSGWARLRDGRMQSADEDEPTLEVRNAIADVESIDLGRRSVRVRSLVLRGMTLRPEPGIAATVLTSLAADPSSRRANDDEAPPWRWSVEQLDASDARLRLDGPTAPIDVAAHLRGENLGPRSHWSPVRASLSYGSASASFEGSVRTSYEEPRLEGRLGVDGLDLPALVRELEVPGAHLVKSGVVNADIDLFLEPNRGGVGVSGGLSLQNVAVAGNAAEPPEPEAADDASGAAPTPAGADGPATDARVAASPDEDWLAPMPPLDEPELPRTLALSADRIDLRVDAPAPPKPRRGPAPVQRWTIDASLIRPFVQVSRDADGWILPSLEPPPDPDAGAAGDQPPGEATPAGTPSPPRPTLPAGEAAGTQDLLPTDLPVTLRRLAIADGHLLYFDGLARPALTFDVRRIYGEAMGLRLSPLAMDEVSFEGWDDGLGVLGLRGFDVGPRAGLELFGDEISLYRSERYLERLQLPYRFRGGSASFTAALRRDPDGWGADTFLVLNEPEVESGTEDAVVPELLGMSLSTALDLLRDQNGDVRIRLPRLTNLHQELGIAIYDAVRQAHEAPSSGGALTPTPIHFTPGQTALNPDAKARLRSIARMVGPHALLRVELAAPASLQDRRWLAEQDVLRRLEDRGGLMDALSLLGVGDDYDQLRQGLRMRARGQSWDLEPDDEESLERLLAEQPPVREERLRTLGARRLESIERFLTGEGVAPDRLARRELPGEDRTTLAAVLVTVLAQPRPMRPPESLPPESGL